jgi:hypothetical protein
MATKEQIQDLINQIGNETRPGQNTATRIATVLNDINWSDTLFYANLSSFPVTGEIEKIYIDESTNLMYIWNANTSQYSPIGGSSDSGSTSGAEVISLTYSELSTLVSGNTLVPGQKYLINDYQTVHLIPNTNDINTGPIEPLLVTASSTKTLEPIAYSTLFPQDIIYYNIESDQNIVSGSTKGYIYRRIDTIKNNDIGFDYRNVKFRRWQINVTTSDLTGSGNAYSQYSVVLKTGTNQIYLKLDNTPSVPFTNTSLWMRLPWSNLQYVSPTNNNLVIDNYTIPVSANYMDYTMFSTEPTINGIQCDYYSIYENKIKGICDGSDIISNLNTVFFEKMDTNAIHPTNNHFWNNTIGSYFRGNTIGYNFDFNTIISYSFNDNIIGNTFTNNTIDYNFYNNLIGNNSNYNIIGNNFNYNIIGYNFQLNHIGNYFSHNITGSNFGGNVIGDNFNYNTIGNSFDSNTIGSNFQLNSIRNYFSHNIIGNNFGGNNPSGNTIGDYFTNNTIEDNFNINNSGMNFINSTYVYQPYPKYLFTNSANGQYLRYYDANNVLQIVQATL